MRSIDHENIQLIDAGLQISRKIRLRSEAKANFFSPKIAKRSEAKKNFVCAKRSDAKIFSKLRKIAKLRIFFQFWKLYVTLRFLSTVYYILFFWKFILVIKQHFGHIWSKQRKYNLRFVYPKYIKKKMFICLGIVEKQTNCFKPTEILPKTQKSSVKPEFLAHSATVWFERRLLKVEKKRLDIKNAFFASGEQTIPL